MPLLSSIKWATVLAVATHGDAAHRRRLGPRARHRRAAGALAAPHDPRGLRLGHGDEDPAEELPEELRMVLTLMLQEKAEKTKKADAGAAVARACGVDNK